jgi:hypothetical protein
MVNNDIIKEVYEHATPIQRHLFSSVAFHEKLQQLALKHAIQSEAQLNLFVYTIGDIVLGLYKTADTVPLLQQELGIDPRTAALLGADVLELLTPLSDPNWKPPVEEEVGTGLVEATAAPVAPTATAAVVTAPEPLHTYAADLSAARGERIPSYQPTPTVTPVSEPGYTSSQSDLRQPLSQIPSYSTPVAPIAPVSAVPAADQPRWSSDN